MKEIILRLGTLEKNSKVKGIRTRLRVLGTLPAARREREFFATLVTKEISELVYK